MVMNTFKEDKEAFWATYKTKWGWISFALGNLIFGYLALKYLYTLESIILDKISFLPQIIIMPSSWILIGMSSSVVGYLILLVVERIVKFSRIKNRSYF